MSMGTMTIRDIVVDDFRTATVFRKYDIDFCCRGGVPLNEACEQRGINPTDLLSELAEIRQRPQNGEPAFTLWDIDFLTDYIINNHQTYIRAVAPAIYDHAEKVARVHGERHPELVDIARGTALLLRELDAHMRKEEGILFPYIKSLAEARRSGTAAHLPPFGTVQNPIRMMEAEHTNAGDEMAELRRRTDNYTPPQDACMTYRVFFRELEDFERDLHRHVHLENNILFPRAVQLEQLLFGKG